MAPCEAAIRVGANLLSPRLLGSSEARSLGWSSDRQL